MKALLYQGPEDIQYGDLADPVPHERNGAVVQISACGICGSDLHIYQGHGFSTDLGFCVGHEAVGTVVEAGSAVRNFNVGDRVLVPASTGCNNCTPCRRGEVGLCERGFASCYGLSAGLQGSQAEAVGVPNADANLVRISDGISDDAALLLTDNAPTAWYGARRANIQPGDTVAVIGLGPVGLFSVHAALLMGASRVFGIDLVPDRRAQAAAIGAEPIDDADVKTAIAEATGGLGVDVVLEAVGADATISLGLDIVRRSGTVSVVGVNQNQQFSFPMALAQVKNLEFHIGLCSVQFELPALMKYVESGRLNVDGIVTHRMALSEGAEAYRIFNERLDGVGKVVLDPTR